VNKLPKNPNDKLLDEIESVNHQATGKFMLIEELIHKNKERRMRFFMNDSNMIDGFVQEIYFNKAVVTPISKTKDDNIEILFENVKEINIAIGWGDK
jgi:translation initiation factor 2 gamma subunit (eIF-2gamma)